MKSSRLTGTLLAAAFFLMSPEGYAQNQKKLNINIGKLIQRAGYYARICYKPGARLENGATISDINQFSVNLRRNIHHWKKQFHSPKMKRWATIQLVNYHNEFSVDAILKCARRNFKFISSEDKTWFKIFDNYGRKEQSFDKIIAPYHETLKRTPLILVGNDHTIVDQGNILFHLTDYIQKKIRAVGGLFIEDSIKTSPKSFDPLRRFIKKNRRAIMKETPEAFARRNITRNFSKAGSLAKLISIPRNITRLRFLATYPDKALIPIDLRDKPLQTKVAAMDLNKLAFLRAPQGSNDKSWLAFYGEVHTLRFPGSDSDHIEKKLKIRPFVISQGVGYLSSDIHRAEAFNLKKIVNTLVAIKFSFPLNNKGTSHLKIVNRWSLRIEKYNTFKNAHTKKLYVNLDLAKKKRALAFNNHHAPADLMIIPPSYNTTNTLAHFSFDKDHPYQLLKKKLGSSSIRKSKEF